MAKIRSSRGVMVDFDQIKIKQQLAQAPSTAEVKAREDFVERRIRRRASRKLLAEQQAAAVLDADGQSEDTTGDSTTAPVPRKQQRIKSAE